VWDGLAVMVWLRFEWIQVERTRTSTVRESNGMAMSTPHRMAMREVTCRAPWRWFQSVRVHTTGVPHIVPSPATCIPCLALCRCLHSLTVSSVSLRCLSLRWRRPQDHPRRGGLGRQQVAATRAHAASGGKRGTG
jgi:hypothetical protein